MPSRKILLLSDTHGFLDSGLIPYMKDADEVWHAGDIGNVDLYDETVACNDQLKAVYGNIDGNSLRSFLPEYQIIPFKQLTILLIHIAGSFGKYNKNVRSLIKEYSPDVLICGHSHILKVGYDKRFNLLYMNPGACGHHGFHKFRTVLQFQVYEDHIGNVEVIELGKRGRSK